MTTGEQTLPLIDRYGRVGTDLRVSLTDRCNLRCSYCMPPEGLPWLPGPELLSAEETVRLITLAVRDLGIEEVRFTGGEPLLRKDLPGLVAGTSALRTPDGRGRVVAAELLIATPAVRNLIREGKTHQIYSAMQAGGRYGMQTMDQSLANHVIAGKISIETALERCSNPEDLRRLSGR